MFFPPKGWTIPAVFFPLLAAAFNVQIQGESRGKETDREVAGRKEGPDWKGHTDTDISIRVKERRES